MKASFVLAQEYFGISTFSSTIKKTDVLEKRIKKGDITLEISP